MTKIQLKQLIFKQHQVTDTVLSALQVINTFSLILKMDRMSQVYYLFVTDKKT